MRRGRKRERAPSSESDYTQLSPSPSPTNFLPSSREEGKEVMSGQRGRGRKRDRDPSTDPEHLSSGDHDMSPSSLSSRALSSDHLHPTRSAPSSSRNQIGSPKMFGTTLLVLNLPADSLHEEVQEYFASVGRLKEFQFHYDQHNNFMCTANLEYVREQDAFAAADQLHNQRFHGHALQLIPLSSFSRR